MLPDCIKHSKQEKEKAIKTACEILDEKTILQTRRVNRHFELVCKKMQTHQCHVCDPGPFILTPFVNDLGIVQSFETHDPVKLHGKEITNLALLNVFRILVGFIIENELKDLVHSYNLDEIYGKDHERIEFELYCVMVARLAYEHFLRTLGGNYLNRQDGNKLTLATLRDKLFEKRNCTIHQDVKKDLVITVLDSQNNKFITDIENMLDQLKKKGKNKVLWWNNRSIILKSKNQFDFLKC
ncbi:hypothetical protein ES705_29342 [subsurface metagenome]